MGKQTGARRGGVNISVFELGFERFWYWQDQKRNLVREEKRWLELEAMGERN